MPTDALHMMTRAGGGAVTVSVSDAATEPAWDGFVESRPEASAYHAWRWRRIFETTFGHECAYLAAWDEGRIVGILPLVLFNSRVFGRFGVSLPFVNYGGVVAETDEAARALLAAASALASERHLSHLELRHLVARFPDLPAKHHKVAMRLALPGNADALWQAIDRKVRNQVRKAEKSGLTAAVGGAELVAEFYAVFARNMRDLGTPVYPRRLFEDILATFPDAARVFVVRHGATPVAGSLTVKWRQTTEVPWASSLREHRASSPNMLLYWTMLQQAMRDGSSTFDFGRSTPDEGTFHFKRQWGAEATPFEWEYVLPAGGKLPDQSPANPKFRLAIALWKRLPVPFATALGPHIVRSIP